MPVIINGHRADFWNNDFNVSSTTASDETNNYISKYGNVGHWIVIYRLDVEKIVKDFLSEQHIIVMYFNKQQVHQ